MKVTQLTQSLKSEAARLGFTLAGACPAVSPDGYEPFVQWLQGGYAGEMHYLEERQEAYRHPESVLDGVASLLMLGMPYATQPTAPQEPGTGRIARYAWGDSDYHDIVHRKLKELKRFVATLDDTIKVRGVVDTAPLMEREFAQLAGMGWKAKNTLLISPSNGSWFFLAALLLDVRLEYDAPFETRHCGTCTACLDACPTDAFLKPHVLDASRCISYLTIEHRSSIPVELRSQMQDWILGCDVCQDVCPWNRKSSPSSEPGFQPIDGHNPIDLRGLFSLDDPQFRKRFRKTPLWRPKRRGLLRNAAIAMGNDPDSKNLAALVRGITDVEPLIRGASAWALGRHRQRRSLEILEASLQDETDPDVQIEIEQAIEYWNGNAVSQAD